jgi:hypothetical protein
LLVLPGLTIKGPEYAYAPLRAVLYALESHISLARFFESFYLTVKGVNRRGDSSVARPSP